MEQPGGDLTAFQVPRSGGSVAAMLGVSVLLAISGYWLAFSTHRDFDDEGLFLQGVRFSLEDVVLYDELVVPFGPAYYMESGLVHGLLSLPPTTDGIRWHLLSLWLAASGVAATVVFALTGRITIALAGQCAVFYCLKSMTNEPGHPQQLVALLLLLTVAASLLWERWKMLAPALLGAAAALLLVKINSGAFAVGSIGLTLAILNRRQLLIRPLLAPILTVAILLPWVLMRERLESVFELRLAIMVSVSLAAAAWVGMSLKPANASKRQLAALPLGFAIMSAVMIGWALARGSTLAAMWQALVVLPSQHAGTYHLPMPMLSISVLSTAGSAVAALWVGRNLRVRDGNSAPVPAAALSWLKTIYGAAIVVMAVGMTDIIWLHFVLLQFALPWCWLVLVAPQPRGTSETAALARMLLCSLALMHSLYVYPVAGSQKALAVVLVIPLAAICLYDGLTVLGQGATLSRRRGLNAAAIAVGMTFLLLIARHVEASHAAFASQVPLGLRGAQRLRMPQPKAAEYRELAFLLREHCGTFLCSDGWNSLYLWTGIEPPSRMIIFHDLGQDQMHWYTSAQKRKTLDRFWASPRPIYVRTRERDSDFFRELDRGTEPWRTVGRAQLRRPKGPLTKPINSQCHVPDH